MTKAMGKTAKVMGAMNRATPVAQQQKMMMAFEKNKEALDMKNEMMDDMLEGDDELSDEADEMLDSVFESIGLDVKGSLPALVRICQPAPSSHRRGGRGCQAARRHLSAPKSTKHQATRRRKKQHL
jgi:hypothetical protein